MKKNCQGFVLVETLIVAVFIVTIFTFLYTSVIPLLGTYESLMKADDIDIVYKLYHIRKAIYNEDDPDSILNKDYKKITTTDFIKNAVCRDNNGNTITCSDTHYQKLISNLDLENYDLVYIKYSEDNSIINKVINDNAYSNIKDYLEKKKDSITNDILLLYDKNTYAIAHLNATIDVKNYFKGWTTQISNQKSNITEVNFVNMETSEMEEKYDAATIKADLTDTTKTNSGKVYGWLEPDTTDTSKYILYVASDGITIFPTSSYQMFYNWTNLKTVDFANVDTKYVTSMSSMFNGCSGLTTIYANTDWNTTTLTSSNQMFYNCSKLKGAIDYNSTKTDATYANPTTGYFTPKTA